MNIYRLTRGVPAISIPKINYIGDSEVQSKFKVGDKVRCISRNWSYITEGSIYVITSVKDGWYRVVTDNGHEDGYSECVFELVEPNPVLTPEEVFEHLRKGTKLEFGSGECYSDFNYEHLPTLNYKAMTVLKWRIKPEPEVIELNGKRYKLIEE